MKVFFGLLLAVGLVLVVVFKFGGYASFDATQQGKDARAKIGRGMMWTKVFDITGNPRRYRTIQRTVQRIGGEEMEFFKPGPANKFKRASVAARIAENSMPHGFMSTHSFSSQEAFTVTFDATGTVVGVEDAMTMADLLQTRD